jgi:hypothetical protein
VSDEQGGNPARRYSWAPFEPGHEVTLKHGARSPRVIGPIAAELIAEVIADESTSYLAAAAYAPLLRRWAEVMAKTEVYGQWLAEQSPEQQTTSPKGGTRSPLEHWLGLVRVAAALSDRLGLSPLARAKLGRDFAVGQSVAQESARRNLDRLKAEGQAAFDERSEQ